MTLILITGAKGFIGQNLARHLSSHGHTVVGLGHGAIAPDHWADFGLTGWLNGDIDHANLQSLGRQHGLPNLIFHLAGGSNVGRSLQNPLEDFNRTVITAGNLFEWVRLESPATAITVVSSAAVYGQGHDGRIVEETPLTPYSPYGAHKAMMELLAHSYADNYGLKLAICRLFSVYGTGLEKQLIYDLCVKCRTAVEKGLSRLELFGTGEEIRDWVHVDDVCRLLPLICGQASAACPIFNGGSGVAYPVREVATLVLKAFGLNLAIEFNGQKRSGDPLSLLADTRRIAELQFCSEVELATGIGNVVKDFLGRGRHS